MSFKSQHLERKSLYLRKQVNQVVSDLSIIGGFCGKREKELIELTNDLAQHILMAEDKIGFVELMQDWCIEVNGIIVDFTKTPFRFVGGEFKVSLRNLEAKIKAILKREWIIIVTNKATLLKRARKLKADLKVKT